MSDEEPPSAPYAVPHPTGRPCAECGAFVTKIGREGVFCDRPQCPHPRLSWGWCGHLPSAAGWKYQPEG